VDIIEPTVKFTDQLKDSPGIGHIYNAGLEEWQPQAGTRYDLIWIQWCVVHLTDVQLVDFLRRCATTLRTDEDGKVTGRIVVKENLTTGGKDLFDEVDSSVTRYVFDKSHAYEHGLYLVKSF
jgi:protein N-terminal methyltransferase